MKGDTPGVKSIPFPSLDHQCTDTHPCGIFGIKSLLSSSQSHVSFDLFNLSSKRYSMKRANTLLSKVSRVSRGFNPDTARSSALLNYARFKLSRQAGKKDCTFFYKNNLYEKHQFEIRPKNKNDLRNKAG